MSDLAIYMILSVVMTLLAFVVGFAMARGSLRWARRGRP